MWREAASGCDVVHPSAAANGDLTSSVPGLQWAQAFVAGLRGLLRREKSRPIGGNRGPL